MTIAAVSLPLLEHLTPKQRLFVINYAITRNGVEAAKQAGYKGSYMTLAQTASQLLKNPQIIAAYDAYMRPVFDNHGITVDRVLAHIADLAFAPWGEYIQVKEKNGRIVEVKMPLKVKADMLKELARMLRLVGKTEDDLNVHVDNSRHLYLHDYKNADEARQALLDYLKQHKKL